jgi:hypothetical protein
MGDMGAASKTPSEYARIATERQKEMAQKFLKRQQE